MRFEDLINSLNKELDPNNVRIISFPDVVWVFGGKTSVIPSELFCSLRNVFVGHLHDERHSLAKFVRLPEDYKEWNAFDGYDDLLEFERDAGYLAKATVIFCECPGALAELGAFASDDHLRSRTIAVVQRSLHDDSSYIALGPIRRIEQADDKATCIIEAKTPADFANEVSLVTRAVDEKIKKAPRTESYNPLAVRDQFLLIADLVELFQAITMDELLAILPHFRTPLDRVRLRKMLRQLVLFQLVAKEQIGNVKYLVSTPHSRACIDYQSTHSLPSFDRSRFKANAFSALKDDPERFRAFQHSRQVTS